MRSGKLAAVATVAVVGLALSGCGSSEPSLSSEQLVSLVEEDDQIDPHADDPDFVWEPVMLSERYTMGSLLEGLLSSWVGQGEPDECFESFIVALGAASDGQQTDDPASQIAFFTNGAERDNHITVGSRTFDTAADATALLDGLPAVFAECPDGFTVAGYAAGAEGFRVDETEGPEGVRIVRIDGGVVAGGYSNRTVLLQRGRDVVVIDAFFPDSKLDLDEIDAYALVLAERLADIPQP